jgi:hypothetical protein
VPDLVDLMAEHPDCLACAVTVQFLRKMGGFPIGWLDVGVAAVEHLERYHQRKEPDC